MKNRESHRPRLLAAGGRAADKQIADGVRKLQALWAQFDTQMFSDNPDHQLMATLLLEINTVRNRLEAHGVKVRV